MTTFNRISTMIERAPAGGYRIRVRYWSTEHGDVQEEVSRRTFSSEATADETAVRVAHALRDRLS